MKADALVDEHGQLVRFFMPVRRPELSEEYKNAREAERQAWNALFNAKDRFVEETGFNGLCFECGRLHNGCIGTKIQTYTGCAERVWKESEERKEVKRCHEQISKLNVVGS